MRLNRERIVECALALVDKVGLEELTTRRLGQELNVEGPALYRHFSSKAELLDYMAAAILLPVMTPPRPDETWDVWLMNLGLKSREAVLRYRDGASIVAASLPIEPLDLISKPLRDAGFEERDAIYASKLFSRFMVGWHVHEESELKRQNLREPEYDHLEAFRFAMTCLIDGLKHRLR